jgi:hypothetical protein
MPSRSPQCIHSEGDADFSLVLRYDAKSILVVGLVLFESQRWNQNSFRSKSNQTRESVHLNRPNMVRGLPGLNLHQLMARRMRS